MIPTPGGGYRWFRSSQGEKFATKIVVIFMYAKIMRVESTNQAPEPPQRFQSGVHDLCKDCDAVKHSRSRKSTNYDNFTVFLRQFYSKYYYSVGSIPISTKIGMNKVWDGYCKIQSDFSDTRLGRYLYEQNCRKIVVNFAITTSFEYRRMRIPILLLKYILILCLRVDR